MNIYRMYFESQYSSNMVAEFSDIETIDSDIFLDSYVIREISALNFKCQARKKNFINQDIINCNINGFIISINAKEKFDLFLSEDVIQYIPVNFLCKDGLLDKLFFVHPLKTAPIIDVENSNKKYFDSFKKDFILIDPIISIPNSLDNIHIGRHNLIPYDTEIYFSEEFVSFIQNNQLDKNILFR